MNCTDCGCELNEDTAYKKGADKLQSKCKSCFNKYCVERWIRHKIEAIEYLGGKCKRCENTFHYSVYDFHHRDPEEKDIGWQKLRLMSKEKRLKELDKCDLVCANCHRLIHHEK